MMKRLFLSIILVASGLPASAQARRAYVPNFLPPGMAQRPPPLILPPLGTSAGLGNFARPGMMGGAPLTLPFTSPMMQRPGMGMGMGMGYPGFGGFRPSQPSFLGGLGSFLVPLIAQLFGGGSQYNYGSPYGYGYGQPALAMRGMPPPIAQPYAQQQPFMQQPVMQQPVMQSPIMRSPVAPMAKADDGELCINCDRTATPAPAVAPVSTPPPVSNLTSTEAGTTKTCVGCDKGPQKTPSVDQIAKVASVAACPSSDTDICNMFAGVNEMRREANMPALKYDPICQAAADLHGRDMASRGFFDHKGSDGLQVDSRYKRVAQGARISAVGENIFMTTNATSTGAEQANQTFKNSKGHHDNIISKHFTHVGLARVQGRCSSGEKCTYYVQCFSHPAR